MYFVGKSGWISSQNLCNTRKYFILYIHMSRTLGKKGCQPMDNGSHRTTPLVSGYVNFIKNGLEMEWKNGRIL